MEVELKDKDRSNLLCLLLKKIIDKNLKNRKIYNQAKNIQAILAIKAGKMRATLCLDKGKLTLENGAIGDSTAYIEGTLDGFLKIGLGGNVFSPIIKRKVKFGGNVFLLLSLMNIFKVR